MENCKTTGIFGDTCRSVKDGCLGMDHIKQYEGRVPPEDSVRKICDGCPRLQEVMDLYGKIKQNLEVYGKEEVDKESKEN